MNTFSELESQKLSVDYTQASKMNKITGRNTNVTVPLRLLEQGSWASMD